MRKSLALLLVVTAVVTIAAVKPIKHCKRFIYGNETAAWTSPDGVRYFIEYAWKTKNGTVCATMFPTRKEWYAEIDRLPKGPITDEQRSAGVLAANEAIFITQEMAEEWVEQYCQSDDKIWQKPSATASDLGSQKSDFWTLPPHGNTLGK